MILDTIANADRYSTLHPLFPTVFQYIRNTDLSALASGRHSIVGDEVFVIIERAAGRSRDAAQLECHRKYIDIQLVLDGIDEMGWKPLTDCQHPVADYNTPADIQFFHDTPPHGLLLRPALSAFSFQKIHMRLWLPHSPFIKPCLKSHFILLPKQITIHSKSKCLSSSAAI